MDCKKINKKIIFYIDNELNQSEKDKVQKHIETCKKCKETYNLLLASMNIISVEKNKKVNPFIATPILEKINLLKQPKQVYKKVLQPVLASLAILLGVFFGHNISIYLNENETTTNEIVESEINLNEADQYAINSYSYDEYYFLASQ